jgi:starch phosphorylase
MRQLFDRHLGPDWIRHSSDPTTWDKITEIDNGELWETHQVLKAGMLAFVRERLVLHAERRGETYESIRRFGRSLGLDALTIGFARRFATYKRANLLFQDLEQIALLINDPQLPVQVVFAGKAHPRDVPGKQVLKEIANFARDPQFAGKVVFVEDYDINVAKPLVQGVDVWLNNPRRPLEASGTSGMKVVLNGGLNLSVLDGWWAEAFDGTNGFAIGSGEMHLEHEAHDRADSNALYSALKDEVIPLFYQRDGDGLPREWIERVKSAIRTLGWRFNADRMVRDYVTECYVPAAGGTSSHMRR